MNDKNSDYFQLLVKSANVIFIETDSTSGEPILSSSANLSSLLGYKMSDFNNNQVMYDDLIFEEDVANYLLESHQGSQSDDCTEVVHSAYRLIHKNGDIVWVKDAAQLIREQGRVCKIVHFLSDISADMELHDELQQQKSRLIDVLHTAGFGLWEWNTASNTIICDENWSKLLGFSQPIPEFRLSRFFALLHPDDLTEFKRSLTDLAQGKTNDLHLIVRIRHLSGKWRHHHLHGNLSGKANGHIGIVNMSHSDITEQKESELGAIAALSTRNQFFARVSHEIRTPLHGILGMLSLVKQDLGQQKANDKIDKIIGNSEHLLFLLNDILDLAKLNEAKLQISIELVSITEVLNQVLRLFSFKAEEKHIKLKTTLPGLQHDMVMTDKVRITQILCNLVSNAVKYTHRGSVHVYSVIENEKLLLCVQDTGIGIKNTADIFDAYKQEDLGVADGSHSTGLGLEIVKKLCDLLGIELALSSSASGSLFTLTLGKPMPNTLVSKPLAAPEASDSKKLAGLHVLVVDDSDINREIVLELLHSVGATCAEALDGYEAVKQVDSYHEFDVILMDKHMPNMNGIDATQQIRKNSELAKQPIIIALTADAFDVDSDKWFSVGVDEIIIKPFDMDILVKTIVRCMRA